MVERDGEGIEAEYSGDAGPHEDQPGLSLSEALVLLRRSNRTADGHLNLSAVQSGADLVTTPEGDFARELVRAPKPRAAPLSARSSSFGCVCLRTWRHQRPQ